jgi:hypothetical protein
MTLYRANSHRSPAVRRILRPRRIVGALSAAVVALGLLFMPGAILPASAAAASQVVATKLTAPAGVLVDPAGRLWVSDSVAGFCRLTQPSGSTPGTIDTSTCLGGNSSNAGPKLPGQPALFNPTPSSPSNSGEVALIPDAASGSANVVRVQWNPSTGLFSYLDTITLYGGDLEPVAVSVGPDGNAYVVMKNTRSIVRIDGAAASQPDVETVGFTAANGNRAIAAGAASPSGNVLLYISSSSGLVQYSAPTVGNGSAAPNSSYSVGTPSSLYFDPSTKTLYAGSASATATGGDSITSVNTSTGAITSSWATGFTRIGGIAEQGSTIVAVDAGSTAAKPGATGQAYLVGSVLPTITGGPTSATGAQATNPAYTDNPKPSFTVSYGGTGTLQCAFDNTNWTACAAGTVTAPTALADGAHTFGVRVGTTGTVVSASFTVDTVPPVAPTVTAPVNGSTIGASTVLQATDEAGATLDCAIDPTVFTVGSVCTSGQTLTFSTAGTHTISVTATDQAGNVSPATTVSVVVSLTAPTVTITQPATDGMTLNGTAAFTFTATGSGAVTYQCKIDTSALAACTSPASYSGLTAGSHTFTVQATDSLGNVATATRVFTFTPADTTPPVITVSPTAGAYPSGQKITLSANETATIYYTVDGSTPTTSSPVYSAPLTLTQNMTLKYFGVDGSGNASTIASQAYTIQAPPPPATAQQDFNSDGFNDVLAKDSSGRLWLYPGNGTGGWLATQQVGSGWNGMNLIFTPGDFNGDGHPDVLARDGSGNLWLYPGDGQGGWGAPVEIGSAWNGMNAIFGVGDFNGDGDADVMARDGSGNLWLYPGNGSGGWGTPVKVGTGWSGMNAIFGVGDFNGDGHPDVMARDGSGNLWLYPGNGSGGWGTPVKVGTGWSGMNAILSVGDFNGDGHTDVLARDGSGNLWLYPGNGSGGWGTPVKIGTGWSGMSAIL